MMKVLIIDDSPDALAIARARLAKEGMEILCAESGRAGLDAAKQTPPDLILLDLDMPDMSGLDVCRTLKADVDLCMIPVIFLSGVCGHEDKIAGLDLGAIDYITKPFDAFELRARVRAALRTKRLQDLLIQYSQVDPLTELCNRRALMERLQQEWARIQRHGGSLAFIMADLDHFKQINDLHGHPGGDRVLCQAASAIFGQTRQSDIAARNGGDEFSILCPDTDAEGAAELAERCRSSIENLHVPLNDADVRITASFGVADSAGAPSAEAMVQTADQTMYEAKRAGGNRVYRGASLPAENTEIAGQKGKTS